MSLLSRGLLAAALLCGLQAWAAPKRPARKKPYRLKAVSLKQRLLWGSECRPFAGEGLAFGGMDQESPDGRGHTRLLAGGAWKPIDGDLRARNPLQPFHLRAWKLRNEAKDIRARARFLYFRGLPADEEAARIRSEVAPRQAALAKGMRALIDDLGKATGLGDYENGQVRFARKHAPSAMGPWQGVSRPTDPNTIRAMRRSQVHLALAAEALDAEPPARALSPLAYDAKTRLYVLFGGDHLDYLTNDTWVFDPAARRWRQCHSQSAPPPRAKHALSAAGDGTVKLAGGYTYSSNTDYCGGQYMDLDDGEFVYDVAAGAWRGKGLVPADTRVYRTGPFDPGFYLRGDRPAAAAFQARLEKLPANEWVATNPPYRPRLNRDWGTAVIDTRRDMMLRWSGGHSAHGGTDVPHFHFATNRWELAYPVEFPLGQLYSNTSYPAGVNFNLRPGMTGHTYQNYGFDPVSGKMVQTGHYRHFYIYDPDRADWIGRGEKPKGMQYGSCFYTLTLCSTAAGVVCWTKDGRLYLCRLAENAWTELAAKGDKLPGARVDSSTLAYDSRRDRVVFFRKDYGHKASYDGRVYALDMKTRCVSTLSPAGMAGAAEIAWLDRCCYDAANDLVLFATFLKGADGWSRTPAYDCASNRWVSLAIKYGVKKAGRRWRRAMPHGHSCGVMFDANRKLLWGTDTNSQVYVLKLEAKAADAQLLPDAGGAGAKP